MFVSKLQDDGSGMRAKTKGKAKRRSWSLSVCLRVLLSGGLFLDVGDRSHFRRFWTLPVGRKSPESTKLGKTIR